MQKATTEDKFSIQWNGKTYTCKPIDNKGTMLYQVDFNNSYLYLTTATDIHGNHFWTSIPFDGKLTHVVIALSEQIENHFQ